MFKGSIRGSKNLLTSSKLISCIETGLHAGLQVLLTKIEFFNFLFLIVFSEYQLAWLLND